MRWWTAPGNGNVTKGREVAAQALPDVKKMLVKPSVNMWEIYSRGFKLIRQIVGGVDGNGHLRVPQGAKFVPPKKWDEDLKGVDWYRTLMDIESGKSNLKKYQEFSGLSIALNNGGQKRLEKLLEKNQISASTTSKSTKKNTSKPVPSLQQKVSILDWDHNQAGSSKQVTTPLPLGKWLLC